MFRDAYSFKQGLLPEAAPAFDSSDGVHNTKRQDAFHRSRHDAQRKSLRIVLIPCLNVERERC